MQRNRMDDRQPRRQGAEKDATQPMAGQPRDADDEEELEQPENVPSPLTAREFQARSPRGDADGEKDTGERHASASFAGSKGEPAITEDEPPRGNRGSPGKQSGELLRGRKGSGRKSH